MAKGYNLIGTYHSPPTNSFLSTHPNVTLHQLQIENRASIDAFYESIKGINHIDFFTSTIGCYTINRFEKTPIETFEKDFSVNFMEQVYILQKLTAHFGKGSNIVLILTEMVAGRTPSFLSTYLTSKYALLGLMKGLSREFEPKGIRVNAVSPGMMDTKFISSMPQFVKETYVKNSRNGRFTLPEEVAKAVEKILSDQTINGENIAVF